MPWVEFHPKNELNQIQKITIEGFDFGFAITTKGPKAFELRCPHQKASLTTGGIVEGGIECSYHGWVFDLANGTCDMSDCTLQLYEVKQEGGSFFVLIK